jgi:methoxymalonate biosynthesis protein
LAAGLVWDVGSLHDPNPETHGKVYAQRGRFLEDAMGAGMTRNSEEHRLVVLGGGVMGSAIAALAVGHGAQVLLVDTDDLVSARVAGSVEKQVRHARLLSALPAGRSQGQLRIGKAADAAADATAVIEAVTEHPDRKRAALAEVSRVVRPGTALITNTSGIPIDELAGELPRPEDLAGAHFMNPAYLIETVEVARGPRTSAATLAAVEQLLVALGRRPVVVGDAPGFVTSRLLHPLINDAVRIVGEGIADADTVDRLMCGCLGHPTGPLRTADLIGLDNLVDSLVALHERTGEDRFRPCELLLEKVAQGQLGRKTGRGFHDYEKALS